MFEDNPSKGFKCINCHKWVPINIHIGTNNRNHCPYCLWSRHVDRSIPGDREAGCDVGMKPIAVIFKKAGIDKYGNKKLGEIMLVHRCAKCNKISINRIAADDQEKEIMSLFEKTLVLDEETRKKLRSINVEVVSEKDRGDLENQLFGK